MSETPVGAALAMLANDNTSVEALRLLTAGENVILYGPPGTGKSFSAMTIADQWQNDHGDDHVIHTTFHPSYSYEDFVEGFRPDPNDPTRFVLTDGTLLRAASQATKAPTLLVIDEINRADVAKVFGELITYIESDKRGREFSTAQNTAVKRSIPQQLFVLGTMNTADKSVSLLDVALRRRFKFIECPPDPAAFSANDQWASVVGGVDLGELLDVLNERLLDTGVARDRLLGQALLAIRHGGAEAELLDRLRYDVYPLVEEYLFSDTERMSAVLPGLVDARRGLTLANLTMDAIRSWVPSASASNETIDMAAEVEDQVIPNAATREHDQPGSESVEPAAEVDVASTSDLGQIDDLVEGLGVEQGSAG